MAKLQQTREFDFNFVNKPKEEAAKLALEQKARRFSEFKSMGTKATIALVVGAAVTIGGIKIHEAHEENITAQITAVEKTIQSVPKQNILDLIEKEKFAVKKTYAQNQILLTHYADYKDLVGVLALENSIGVKATNNLKLQVNSLEALNKDTEIINKMVNNLSATREQKIHVFLDNPEVNKYYQWVSSVNKNEFMYVGGALKLNKDIANELTYLKDTQNDIIKNVEEKIKSKDYDLSSSQTAIEGVVKKETTQDIKELNKVRSEIAGTESDSILTSEDVVQATDGLREVQNAALAKISQDRTTVEGLIQKIQKDPSDQDNNQNNANTTALNQAPTTVVHHHGMSFMDYYVIHTWLSSGSGADNYNKGFNAGVNSANNAALRSPATTLYSAKNPSSYLSKNLATNNTVTSAALSKARSATAKMPDISAIRAKIEVARSKAMQASNNRHAEVARSNAAKASAKASMSSSKSSTSRGGFGGSHASSSGG